jgi:hypothetical protein
MLYYWPGDHRWDLWSKARYFRIVDVAVRAGRLLADNLSLIGTPESPLSVEFVGHSLGCRVVLSALEALKGRSEVNVHRAFLMAAAVPEGLCQEDMIYGSQQVAGLGKVIFSHEDRVLRRGFRLGQWAARHLVKIPDTNPGVKRAAVGLSGGPSERWDGEDDSCDLGHGQYWMDRVNVEKLVPLFKEPSERMTRLHRAAPSRSTPENTVKERRTRGRVR